MYFISSDCHRLHYCGGHISKSCNKVFNKGRGGGTESERSVWIVLLHTVAGSLEI
jgi:hypothetical protein